MIIGLIMSAALAATNPAIAQSDQEAADQSTIVVTGKRNSEKEIRDFVKALTPVPYGGQISRFEQTICPVAVGLPQPQADAVAGRMRRVAEAAGLRVSGSDCTPNVVVIVTADKKALFKALRQSRPDYFGDMSPSRIREIAREPGPALAWQVAGPPLSARGQELYVDPALGVYVNRTTEGSSRITTPTRPQFEAAIVIVEARSLDGLTTTQLADYAAMRAFADADPAKLDSTAPSILRILEAPMGSEIPITLTQWDLSFLRGLYTSPRNLATGAQRSAISENMTRELEKGTTESSIPTKPNSKP